MIYLMIGNMLIRLNYLRRFVAKSGMDYMPVFGSLIWICEKDFSKLKINNLVGNIKKIFNESDNHLSIGILENGISVRFLGSSSQDARKCFFCIWKHNLL